MILDSAVPQQYFATARLPVSFVWFWNEREREGKSVREIGQFHLEIFSSIWTWWNFWRSFKCVPKQVSYPFQLVAYSYRTQCYRKWKNYFLVSDFRFYLFSSYCVCSKYSTKYYCALCISGCVIRFYFVSFSLLRVVVVVVGGMLSIK